MCAALQCISLANLQNLPRIGANGCNGGARDFGGLLKGDLLGGITVFESTAAQSKRLSFQRKSGQRHPFYVLDKRRKACREYNQNLDFAGWGWRFRSKKKGGNIQRHRENRFRREENASGILRKTSKIFFKKRPGKGWFSPPCTQGGSPAGECQCRHFMGNPTQNFF